MVTWTTCAFYVLPCVQQEASLDAVGVATSVLANCLQLLTVAMCADDTGQSTHTSCLVEWYVLRISVPLLSMSLSSSQKCTVHWWSHFCPQVRIRCHCSVVLIFLCPFQNALLHFFWRIVCVGSVVWLGSVRRSHTLIAQHTCKLVCPSGASHGQCFVRQFGNIFARLVSCLLVIDCTLFFFVLFLFVLWLALMIDRQQQMQLPLQHLSHRSFQWCIQ